MQKITLYRYIRPDGGVTVSPVKPDCECAEMVRLVADDGRMLTDGFTNTSCVDTDDPSAWKEEENTESVGAVIENEDGYLIGE